MELCAWTCQAVIDCPRKPEDLTSKCREKPRLMYYFDGSRNSCALFLNTGCGDNGNKFHTLRQCEVTCQGSTCIEPPDDPNYCKEKKKTYSYNKERGICVQRNDCDRGGRNFKNIDDCRQKCE
ncbi:hypothetical protein V5799_004904, partial [Amblyomma americanum]